MLTPQQKQAFGRYKVSLKDAVDLEGRIADRAQEVEQDLMRQGNRLNEGLHRATNPGHRQVLGKAYLHVMAQLAHVRRARVLGRSTCAKLGGKPYA